MIARGILLGLICASAGLAQSPAKSTRQVPLIEGDRVFVRLVGTHHLKCKSRWHDINTKSKLAGSVILSHGELRQLFPERMSTTAKSAVAENDANVFWKKVFEALKLTPGDEAAWAKWTGSGQQNQTAKVSCSLKRGPAREQGDKGAIGVSAAGTITVTETGRMNSRYGPNDYEQRWNLTVHVDVIVSKEGNLKSILLKLAGTVDGRYYSGGNDIGEKFSAKVLVNCRAPEVTAAARKEFASLLAELAHAKSKNRKGALAKAKALPDTKRAVLIDLLSSSSDPELRHIAKLLGED